MNQRLERDESFPAWLTLSWAWEQSLDDPAAVKAALARNLRRYREGRALSQKKLAKAAGMTLGQVRDIEAGEGLPPIDAMVRLADRLGVSCVLLVEPSAAPNTPTSTPSRRRQRERIEAAA